MGLEDEHALMQIKQKLGGSVKLKATLALKVILLRIICRMHCMSLVSRIWIFSGLKKVLEIYYLVNNSTVSRII